MNKLVITSTAYGYLYTDIFLNQQLKAFLDPTNIPNIREQVEFAIFTDEATQPLIEKHESYKRLADTVPTMFKYLQWSDKVKDDSDKYSRRYPRLLETLQRSIQLGLDSGAWVMPLCADLIPAQKFIPNVMFQLHVGYDAVFVQPPRAAAESAIPKLNSYFRAFPSEPLFQVAYENLHPLWLASHWETTQFTKAPYTLLWNSGTGVMARSFSVTPIIFKPTREMLSVEHTIDIGLPQFFKNPYWAEDWDHAPIIEIAPLSCHYPPFLNHMSSVEYVRGFKDNQTIASQADNLKRYMYYPNKITCALPEEMLEQSNQIVEAIL